MPTKLGNITGILSELRGANREEVLRRLVPLLYAELATLARAQLRNERPGHTLQTADLVHETYLRLAGAGAPGVLWCGIVEAEVRFVSSV